MTRAAGAWWRSGVWLCMAFAVTLGARPAAAQQRDAWNYHARGLTRQDLTQLLARFRAAAQSPAYSAELRARVQRDADSISARLRDGDLRTGDRLRLRVDGQAQLTDTFVVGAGPGLLLPVVGPVDLHGVLRSELERRIAHSVDSVYRDAPVHVELLIRLVVMGGVGRPGFYALPREALVDDAITAAGGLSPDGRLARAYIERGGAKLWDSDSLQMAMRELRTVGDLGLQPGDAIVIPTQLPSDPQRTVLVLSYLLSLPVTFYTLLHLF